MGGENSPKKSIEGLSIFLKKNKTKDDFLIQLFGDEKIINKELLLNKINNDNIKIIHTSSVVSDEETPLTAVKNARNTSMWNSVKSQIDGNADITLSAGNTGVLLVISRMILKMMNEVSKPALAGLWPSNNGMNVVLDLGANIECNDKNLIDFAELGSALFKSLFPTEKPKVSLLNVGSEEIKGTEMLKIASQKLKDLSDEDNFIYKGYIEGNNIMSGESNVIVTDGFTGNIALKTAEGTARMIKTFLKDTLNSSIISKLGSFFASFALNSLRDKLDPSVHNCGIFVGLNAPVIKCHGASDHVGITYASDLLYLLINDNINDKVKKTIEKLNYD